MPVDRPFTRRNALAVTGGLAVAGSSLALASCGSSPGAASTPTATTSTAGGSDSPAPATSDTTPSARTTPAGSGAALAALSDIPVGSAVSAQDAGKPIVVAQPSRGRVAAFSAICTHMGCTVAPAGKTLNCPCHGSVYDAATGKVLQGPAPAPLPAVAVHLEGGNVFAGAS